MHMKTLNFNASTLRFCWLRQCWSLTAASLLLVLILSPQQWGNKPLSTIWSIGINSMNHTQASKPASTLVIHWHQQCEVIGCTARATKNSLLRPTACNGRNKPILKNDQLLSHVWSTLKQCVSTLQSPGHPCVKHTEAITLCERPGPLASPVWNVQRQ